MLHPHAFTVEERDGLWVAHGANGSARKSYPDRDMAEAAASSLRQRYERAHAEVEAAESGRDEPSGTPPASAPEPPPPLPFPFHSPAPPAPSPLAHQVASFSSKSDGYGVFGRDGGIEKTFDSREAAEEFAEVRRKFFEDLAKGVERAAASVPPPTVAPFGDHGAKINGQAPAPVASPWPASAFQHVPGPTPTVWPAGMGGSAGPGPASPTASPWPAGMEPKPVAPSSPFPASMHGFPTPPQAPVGPGGFPAGMTPAPQVPLPTYGPAVPGPEVLRDLLKPLKQAFADALPHPGHSRFDWKAIGASLGEGMKVVGNVPESTGVSARMGEWARVGSAIAGGFVKVVEAGTVVWDLAEKGRQYSEGVNASNRRLAGWNGEISSAMIGLDMGDMSRDYRMAQATAGTSAALARAVNEMREGWQGYDVASAGVSNRLGIAAATMSGIVGKVASVGGMGLSTAMDYVDPQGTALSEGARGLMYGLGGAVGGLAGFFLGGPAGAYAGFAAGSATVAAIDAAIQPAPGAVDPWGDFLRESQNMPPLRAPRTVTLF